MSRFSVLLLCSIAAMHVPAFAEFPERAVRIIVPYPAGGSFDLLARAIAPRMSKGLGQSVVVENRAGAAGVIGVEAISRASPDGHTIGLAAASTHTVPVALGMKLPYDPLRDFTPLSLLVKNPICIVVHPDVPVRTLKDLADHARARPDSLFYGSSGNGSFLHLLGEMFNQVAGTKITHVPYKGGADQITGILSGQTQVSILPVQNALPHIKSGKMRALAVLDPVRHPDLPEVPASNESFPEFKPRISWIAAFAPPGVSPEIAARWHRELLAALKDPEVRKILDANALVPIGSTAAELQQMLEDDVDAWTEIVRKANIKVGQR